MEDKAILKKCPECGKDIVITLGDGQLKDVQDREAWTVKDWK